MGHIYKHVSTRWFDAENRHVPPNTPGARKENEESIHYWAKYRDAEGNLKRENLRLKDEKNARLRLYAIEQEVERHVAGIADPFLENAKRPLCEHLDEWNQSLELRQLTKKRLVEMPKRVEKLVKLAGWKRLNDITPDSVQRALKRLGVSVQTRNHYLQHLKQFLRWCVPDRLKVSPIERLSRENANTDKHHHRRALTSAEKKLLISTVAHSSVKRFDLDGESRELLYTLAMYTGFRRAELKSLTPESFDLENSKVTLAAAYSKHRQTDEQPLPPWLCGKMREWFSAGKELWPELTKHTSKMFRADLKQAGIPYVEDTVDGKKFADFHSLRHTFVTEIANTKASLKEMMSLTRHASSDLFLRVYAKATMEGKANCINQLGNPLEKTVETTETGGEKTEKPEMEN